jgi:hypothetical protein
MARRVPFPPSSIPAYIEQSMKLIVCPVSYHNLRPESQLIPSHLEGDRSSIAHRDKRKPPQYGGHWNNIQDLS